MSAIIEERDQQIAGPWDCPTCLTTSGVVNSIGCTPMVFLRDVSEATGCHIYAKAEYLNPGGSVKDRIARAIILGAEQRGELMPDSTILEVTSGNTGIALSMVGAVRGYKVVIVMPRSVSEERRNMIRSLGAELHLIEELNDIQSAVKRTVEIAAGNAHVFLPSQFSNPDNTKCHETTTGPEIISQLNGDVDAFVMGVGTGGTLMGVGRALRKAGLTAKIVAVEPDESAVMSGDKPGHHGIQGLADGFIPDLIDLDEIDSIIRIKTDDAVDMSRRLSAEEGLFVGISAGANVLAARCLASELGPGHTIATVLPDRGERYLSMSGQACP